MIAHEEQVYQRRIENAKTDLLVSTETSVKGLESAKKSLVAHLKKHKADIFPGKTDRVTVTCGVLLRQVAKVVRKARHITVEFLRGEGLEGGIHIEESVDWKAIDTWPDDQLALIGTERREKESYAYELTEESCQQ